MRIAIENGEDWVLQVRAARMAIEKWDSIPPEQRSNPICCLFEDGSWYEVHFGVKTVMVVRVSGPTDKETKH